jgi:hypothetical protein
MNLFLDLLWIEISICDFFEMNFWKQVYLGRTKVIEDQEEWLGWF